jgi:YD repeat-containing protein
MKDVVNYYLPTEDFVLLEVEALGEIETEGDKSVTDKLKVIRVVPKEEYTFNAYEYEYEYDSFGNMIKTIFPSGDVFQYEYDSFGNKIKEIDPSGDVYLWEYDSFGNKIKEIAPNGDTWSITIQ